MISKIFTHFEIGVCWVEQPSENGILRVYEDEVSPNRHVGSATFTATFEPGYTYQTTVIFGIMKDVSLLIHSLASFNCFTYRNLFQDGAKDIKNG